MGFLLSCASFVNISGMSLVRQLPPPTTQHPHSERGRRGQKKEELETAAHCRMLFVHYKLDIDYRIYYRLPPPPLAAE